MATVFRFENGEFIQKPGNLQQISVGDPDTIWGVNDKSQVFVWNGHAFSLILDFPNSGPFFDVVRATQGHVWAMDTNTKGLVFIDPNRTFTNLDVEGKRFRNVVAGNQQAWAITGESTYLLGNGGDFTKFDLPLQQISCGPDGNPWGLDSDGGVFFFDSDNRDFHQLDAVIFDQISVGASFPGRGELQVWALKRNDETLIPTHDVWRAVQNDNNPDLFEFHLLEHAELMIVSAGTANGEDVWGINHFHKIFQFDGNEFVSRDDSRREWKAVSIGLRNEVWALA